MSNNLRIGLMGVDYKLSNRDALIGLVSGLYIIFLYPVLMTFCIFKYSKLTTEDRYRYLKGAYESLGVLSIVFTAILIDLHVKIPALSYKYSSILLLIVFATLTNLFGASLIKESNVVRKLQSMPPLLKFSPINIELTIYISNIILSLKIVPMATPPVLTKYPLDGIIDAIVLLLIQLGLFYICTFKMQNIVIDYCENKISNYEIRLHLR